MPSPFVLMFDQLQRSLSSLHWHTTLLESFGWDDEEFEQFLKDATQKLQELHDQTTEAERNNPIVLVALKESLRTIAHDDQIHIFMEMLQAEAAFAASGNLGMEVDSDIMGIVSKQAEA